MYKIFRMDNDKLKLAMLSSDWEGNVANNDNFYRLLFRMEKKVLLCEEDTNMIFKSYKNWKVQMDQLIGECTTNNTLEDRKAVQYAECLDEDIVKHIETIITSIKCENENILEELLEKARKAEDKKNAMDQS